MAQLYECLFCENKYNFSFEHEAILWGAEMMGWCGNLRYIKCPLCKEKEIQTNFPARKPIVISKNALMFEMIY